MRKWWQFWKPRPKVDEHLAALFILTKGGLPSMTTAKAQRIVRESQERLVDAQQKRLASEATPGSPDASL